MTQQQRRTQVVVVGNGMVGSRFVEDLLSRDGGTTRPAGQAGDTAQFDVTVLGAEAYEPYNRVLLSEVVAGKVDVASLTLPALVHERATVHRGARAVHLDRRVQRVLTDDGAVHAYDVLVLATGADARIPPILGLGAERGTPDRLPVGVHALRTLDDAREIVAATVNARRAVVVGAGVLGLEAACGLARRGLAVTVVHGGPNLMDRQLDAAAAAVAAQTLATLGIAQRVDARTDEVLVEGGRATGLRISAFGDPAGAPGEVLPTDLLVLACGTVAATDLAESAGLPVDRGVVVTDSLASPADPRVFAIGDCAQPPAGASGLIAQGWDQSRRLADHLTARVVDESRYGRVRLGGARLAPNRPSLALRLSLSEHQGQGTSVLSRPVGADGTGDALRGTDVVRLKAAGLDVVSMGVCGVRTGDAPGQRTVRLSDPAAGRYVEVVVADGLVVGATCVGAPQIGADLTAAYTRRTPVPADPAYLVLQPVASGAAPASDPTHMPDRTTVCRCNGVTKGDIVECWQHGGARSVDEIAAATRATTGCGGCREVVCGLADWLSATSPADEPAGSDAVGSDAARAPVPAASR